jgi:hypothetical protein
MMYAHNFLSNAKKKERSSGRAEEAKKKGSKQGKKRTVVFMGRDAAALPPKLISNVTTPASDQV